MRNDLATFSAAVSDSGESGNPGIDRVEDLDHDSDVEMNVVDNDMQVEPMVNGDLPEDLMERRDFQGQEIKSRSDIFSK